MISLPKMPFAHSPSRRLCIVAMSVVALLPSCETLSHTERGALGGAGIGAVAGALAGSAVGRPGAGAALGAGVGGVSGGLIGNSLDRSEERQAARQAQATAPRGPLGLTDVASMAAAHVSDDIIVSQIRSTGSVYELSASDIVWLKNNGVSDRVVAEMQQTRAHPRRNYAVAPVYPVPVYHPVYVAEPCYPPPPPPVGVSFGIGYVGRRR